MATAVIGGGMMGLATAYFLARETAEVTVFEKEVQVGGLSRSVQLLPDLRWDKFYHVILSTDRELLDFVEEIGLSLDVRFTETKTGFFTGGRLYSMSSTLEFLKFKPLSLWSKLRLAAGILYVNRINDWSRLEKLYVKAWLIRVFGRRTYEQMWDPLLRSKLGASREQAAASFIWATIRRLYGTRHSGAKRELMGCVREGYSSILARLKERLAGMGVEIREGQGVQRVEPLPGGGAEVRAGNGVQRFDRVVLTVPNPEVLRLCPALPEDYRRRLESVRYLDLVCMTLVLRRGLSPFYVTNITDPGFPFTGLIDATNVVPPEVLHGKGLVYLPRYLSPGDAFAERSDEQVAGDFLRGVRRIHPGLSERDIITAAVNRERYVQPILEVGYSRRLPPMRTPLDGVYLVNTTMILNSTLNNNQVIGLARRLAGLVREPGKAGVSGKAGAQEKTGRPVKAEAAAAGQRTGVAG
ncbi:MAG: NAD(P)/FAD-dependent oxidoreductase [Spirochaetota bacterium]